MNLKTIYPLLELAATHLLPLLNSTEEPKQLMLPEVDDANHRLLVTIIIDTKADSLEEAKSLVTSRLVGIGAKEVEIHEAQSQV